MTGVELDTAEKKYVRERLGRMLERFGPDITRAVVRFEDVNGPRGGVDTTCRIKLSVSGMDHIVVEARSTDARAALLRASIAVQRRVVRAMDRLGRTAQPVGIAAPAPREDVRRQEEGEESHALVRRPEGGSLIGRRVGRSRANLLRAAERPEKVRRDAWVDTSLPGVSASDRKAGGGSTAARNTRLRAPRATATLEDSAQRPSRKSTRKSANRQKSGSKLQRRKRRAVHAPSARARRAG